MFMFNESRESGPALQAAATPCHNHEGKHLFLRSECPGAETLAQDIACLGRSGRGLFARSLAVRLQDSLACLVREEEKKVSEADGKRQEAEEMSKLYEEDNNDLMEKNEQLEAENSSLKSKCASYEGHFSRTQSSRDGDMTITIKCGIKENFPAEIKEYFMGLLWEAAGKAKANLDKESYFRKFQVLEDFMQKNVGFNPEHSEANKIAAKIENALKQDNTGRQLRSLEKCGFEIVSEQKHPKIRYHGDRRFQFSSPATPGDWRSTKNLKRELINKCLLLT